MVTAAWYFLAVSGVAVMVYALIVAPIIPLIIVAFWYLFHRVFGGD